MPRFIGTGADDTVAGFASLPNTFDNFGIGADVVSGGVQNDVFNLLVDDKTDTIDGGRGEDLINYSASDRALTIDLSAGHVTAWFLNSTPVGFGLTTDTLELATVANVTNVEDVIGSRFGDTIIGTTGSNVLEGGGGADYINGGGGFDTASYAHSLTGVQIDLNQVVQHGGDAEGDQLYSIEGVIGSAQADHILGNWAGNNVIEGGAGADILYGGGDASINGVHVFENTASYLHSSAGVQVNLGQVVQHGGDAEGDQLYSFNKVLGSAHDDQLTGNSANNTINGEGGNDTIFHTGGSDFIDGGTGVDTYVVGHLNTSFGVSISLDDHQVGYQTVDNPLGLQTLTPLLGTTVEFAHTDGSAPDVDQLTHIENLVGSQNDDYLDASHIDPAIGSTIDGGAGQDQITGSAGSDHLYGGDGNDTIHGGAGDDWLYGGNDDDTLVGGTGADYLDGGSGNNTADYSASSAGVNVTLSTATVTEGGSTSIVHVGHGTGGDAQGDTLVNIQTILGSKFADTLTGDDHANVFDGGFGNDVINGGAGNDTLFVDIIGTSLGIDPGNKTLTGGADADKFVFNFYDDGISDVSIGHDTITDFQPGIDTLELANLTPLQGVHVSQVGDDALLTIDHVTGSITLLNTHAADVHWMV